MQAKAISMPIFLLFGREVLPGAVNLHGLRSKTRQRVYMEALDTRLGKSSSLFPFQGTLEQPVLNSNAEFDVE